MKEIVTRKTLLRDAEALGLEEEFSRMFALAQQVLHLKPDESNTATAGFQLRFRGGYKTVFRMGSDCEHTGQPCVNFPFDSWRTLKNPILEALRTELLDTVPRLDKGSAVWNLRLALTPNTIDDLIVAISIIYRELRRAHR
jgi:hypothetical protein